MYCYRLCLAPFRALDGAGARRYGGRWNRPGLPAVYASSSRALAVLEVLAHLDRTTAPSRFHLLTLEVPDTLPVETLPLDRLARDWGERPAPESCRTLGDAWLTTGAGAVLAVPSLLVPEEPNLILNPLHPDFACVRVAADREFGFDARLMR